MSKVLLRLKNQRKSSKSTLGIVMSIGLIALYAIYSYFHSIEPHIKGLDIVVETKASEHLRFKDVEIKARPEFSNRGRTLRGWNLHIKGIIQNISDQKIFAMGDIKLEFFNDTGGKIGEDSLIPMTFISGGQLEMPAGESKSFEWPIIDKSFEGRNAQGLKKCVVSIEEGTQPFLNKK